MAEILDIGSRMELFIDKWLIDKMSNTSLKLNPPQKKEIVMTFEKPWEGSTAFHVTVFKDDSKIKLYYRGSDHNITPVNPHNCYAESVDGITFTRPNLGLVEFNGSTDNNIIFTEKSDYQPRNFSPFLDRNPACKSNKKYKAIARDRINDKPVLIAFSSADGLSWRKMQDEPIITKGWFDSHNIAFWDELQQCYRCFARYFTEERIRAIYSYTSTDFLNWSEPTPHQYDADVPLEQFYTNATIPCPDAPHILLSFPMRYVPDRQILPDRPSSVADAVFMTSRNGVNWDRSFMEAWVRPGLDKDNWGDRSAFTAWGIVQLNDIEYSLYMIEHYRLEDVRLRRMTVRKNGFASINAGFNQGECLTKPLTFSGNKLMLNYSTSAAGSIQVEIQHTDGTPIDGYSLAEMEPLYGDELTKTIYWENGSDLSQLQGKPVRFRFVLKDADIYAMQTC